mmetsp:Transcript_25917/g.65092  ORF Transcript_25917/g.65092 Transcript_25917/m.65092 type:complete len:480 (-) Transcript_25917:997-2436(-)
MPPLPVAVGGVHGVGGQRVHVTHGGQQLGGVVSQQRVGNASDLEVVRVHGDLVALVLERVHGQERRRQVGEGLAQVLAVVEEDQLAAVGVHQHAHGLAGEDVLTVVVVAAVRVRGGAIVHQAVRVEPAGVEALIRVLHTVEGAAPLAAVQRALKVVLAVRDHLVERCHRPGATAVGQRDGAAVLGARDVLRDLDRVEAERLTVRDRVRRQPRTLQQLRCPLAVQPALAPLLQDALAHLGLRRAHALLERLGTLPLGRLLRVHRARAAHAVMRERLGRHCDSLRLGQVAVPVKVGLVVLGLLQRVLHARARASRSQVLTIDAAPVVVVVIPAIKVDAHVFAVHVHHGGHADKAGRLDVARLQSGTLGEVLSARTRLLRKRSEARQRQQRIVAAHALHRAPERAARSAGRLRQAHVTPGGGSRRVRAGAEAWGVSAAAAAAATTVSAATTISAAARAAAVSATVRAAAVAEQRAAHLGLGH